MQLQQRRNFFIIFAIFFVICLPFMVILSLGYSINTKNSQLRNSLSIKINTIPQQANITINDELKSKSPSDLSVPENQNLDLKVQLDGFATQQFKLASENDSNSMIDLSGLWLLPLKNDKINGPDFDTISIINENLAITQSKKPIEIESTVESTLSLSNSSSSASSISVSSASALSTVTTQKPSFIQSFGLSGFDSAPQLIVSQDKLNAKSNSLPQLEQSLVNKLTDKTTKWLKISNSGFFANNTLLLKREGFWQIIDLSKFNINVSKALKIDDNHLLFLDNQKKLWVFDSDNLDLKFIDQNVDNIISSGSPNKIWLWRYNSIFKFNPSDLLNASNFDWNKGLFLKNGLIGDEVGGVFDIQNVFQGTAIQIGKYIFYVPDYRDSQWQLLTTNTKLFATENETLFWLDNDNNLTSFNLYNNSKKLITTLPVLPESMGFVKDWNRLVFYSTNSVSSIWFNKEIVNNGVKSYYLNTWIENQQCFHKVINKAQYCVNNGNLVVYKNNLLF